MSKSRSEEKDREKERDKAKEKEREAERDHESQEEEALQEESREEEIVRQQCINQMHLPGEYEEESRSPTSDAMMLRSEASIPSSPPPSYEHVLEQQTRLQHEAEVQKQKCVDALDGQYYLTRPDKNSASGNGQKSQAKGPEILHKSSKEFYRAVAKQWGITCKMSDHCRCLDCQSRYFDCEYEKNENQKTDGGLGAGTPMFISEVMQGSGCVLL